MTPLDGANQMSVSVAIACHLDDRLKDVTAVFCSQTDRKSQKIQT